MKISYRLFKLESRRGVEEKMCHCNIVLVCVIISVSVIQRSKQHVSFFSMPKKYWL